MIFVPQSGGGKISTRSLTGSDKSDAQDAVASDKTGSLDGSSKNIPDTSLDKNGISENVVVSSKPAEKAEYTTSTVSPDTVSLSSDASKALEEAERQMAAARRVTDLSVKLGSLMTPSGEKIKILDELASLKAYPQIASFVSSTPEAYWSAEGMSGVVLHALDVLSNGASKLPMTPNGQYDWGDRSPEDAFRAIQSIAEHSDKLPKDVRGRAVDMVFTLSTGNADQDTTGVAARGRMRSESLKVTIRNIAGNRNIDQGERLALLDRYYGSDPKSAVTVMASLYGDEGLRPSIDKGVRSFLDSGASSLETATAMLEDKSIDPGLRTMIMDHLMKKDPERAIAFLKTKAPILGFLPSLGLLPAKTYLEIYATDTSIPRDVREGIVAAFSGYCEKNGDASGIKLLASVSEKRPEVGMLASAKISQGKRPV